MKATIFVIAIGIAVTAIEDGNYFYAGVLSTVALWELSVRRSKSPFSLVWDIFSDVSKSKRGYLDFMSANFDNAVIKETTLRAQTEGILVTERDVRKIGFYRAALVAIGFIVLFAAFVIIVADYAV